MSDEISILTRANPWRKARSVSQTSTSFVSKIPVGIDPYITAGLNGESGTDTGSSLIRMTDEVVGGQSQNGVEFLLYGTGADDSTLACRVIAWAPLQNDRGSSITSATQIWIPVVLIEVDAVLSTCVGVAGKAIAETDRFADTITLVGTTANADINVNIVSPANNTPARVYLDLEGAMMLEFSFDMGNATGGNALYRFF